MGAFAISLQVLISLDVWFLGGLWEGDRTALGQYMAALKVAQTLIVIPIVQSGVLLSSVAWALSSQDGVGARRHVIEASRFALVLTVAACAIVGGNASSLMSLLYSDAYADGGRFLILQLIAFTCFALMDAYAHSLMAAGRQRVTAAVLMCFIPIAAAANYFLIRRLGPMGAAASLVVGMAGVAVVIGALVWRQFGPPVELRTLGRVGIAGGLAAVSAVAIRASGALVLLEMFALGIAYLLLLALMGEISREDFALPRVPHGASSVSAEAESEAAAG
jgi:O-antigen/teichoic acid export membrane protein